MEKDEITIVDICGIVYTVFPDRHLAQAGTAGGRPVQKPDVRGPFYALEIGRAVEKAGGAQ